jgi:hypothetical protein
MKRRQSVARKLGLLRFLVVATCLAIIACYVSIVTPWILGWNQGIIEFGDLNSIEPLRAKVVLRLFHSATSNQTIGFELHHIVLPPRTCVEKVSFRENTDHLAGANGTNTSRFKPPYKQRPVFPRDDLDYFSVSDNDFTEIRYSRCSNEKALWINGYEGVIKGMATTKHANPLLLADPDRMALYYYPFDQQTAAVDILGVFSKDSERIPNVPSTSALDFSVAGWLEFPQSDETISIVKHGSSARTITIDLRRQQARRLLSIVLLSSALMFIVLLPFVGDTSTFIELSVAVVFGLWGIQGIIVPTEINDPTIVQSCILALYLLYALIVFIRIGAVNALRFLDKVGKRSQRH